ncbi:MAG: RsmE family RNA methyltransferase [Actinomycetota bacterium]|nr:RsmE family RNA methyltransferase [Actinomycetota bacterium]
MTTPRFFVPKEKIASQLVTIEGEELRHLKNAIRPKAGDRAEVFDGLGNLYLVELTEVGKDRALGRQVLASTHEEKPAPTLTLCQSILKGPAMDLVIQKATELGVNGIYPVMTERSVVEISIKKGEDKVNRWQRIAIEASKQSKRLHIPKVFPIMGVNYLKSVISSLDFTILFWEEERLKTVKQIRDESGKPSSIGVIIGPEGGFPEGEVDLIKGLGAKVATLGKNILKAETAAIVALAVIAHEFGGDP